MDESRLSQTRMTPLLVVGAFISLTELVVGIAASNTTGDVQKWLIGFVCVFPVLIAVAFFVTLWTKPFVFYPPTDFGSRQDVGQFVAAMQGKPKDTAPLGKKEIQADATQPPPDRPEEQQPVVQSDSKPASAETNSNETPKTARDLEREMMVAFFDGSHEKGEELYLKLIEAAESSLKKREHEAMLYYLRFVYAQDGHAFEQLRSLTRTPEVRSLAYSYIGLAYMWSKDFAKAADAFESALPESPTNSRASRYVYLANSYARDDRTELAIQTLMVALPQFNEPKDVAAIYEGLADIYESTANLELRALALEKAVEQKPNDTNLRFKTAWSYSNHGLRELALFHYRTALSFQSDLPGALNNIGVEFEHFDLPISAVRKYKAAFEQKNTLAAANLAHQFMNAGFRDEAKEVLGKARTDPNVHPNVGSALATLSEREEAEEKKTKELLLKAAKEQKFFKLFGAAYFKHLEKGAGFPGEWQSQEGHHFTISSQVGQIGATWLHSEERHTLSGTIRNRGAKIDLKVKTEKKDGEGASRFLGALLATTNESKGYAYVTEDGQEMQWLLLNDNEPSYFVFARVA